MGSKATREINRELTLCFVYVHAYTHTYTHTLHNSYMKFGDPCTQKFQNNLKALKLHYPHFTDGEMEMHLKQLYSSLGEGE